MHLWQRCCFNSLIMALMISIGKIAISLLSAFAIVYFRFPFRMTCFWIIFMTLMLPVEVRISAYIRSGGKPWHVEFLCWVISAFDRLGDSHLSLSAVFSYRPR